MPLIIPVQPVPSQILSASLGGQTCQISLYQKNPGLFCDLAIGTTPIVYGVLCRQNTKIVQLLYLGFIGDLAFVDTQASMTVPPADPIFSGLGTRFVLAYFSPAELQGLG